MICAKKEGRATKILEVNLMDVFGGGETHFVSLVSGLLEKGHAVIAAVKKGGGLERRLKQEFVNGKLSIVTVNTFPFITGFSIYRVLRKFDVDIIHSHSPRDYLPSFIASSLGMCPLVITRHVAFPVNPVNTFFYRRAAKLIAVSEFTKTRLMESLGIEEGRIEVVYNGVDTDKFMPDGPDSKKRDRKKNFLVGIIGSVEENKGQLDFVFMAEKILERRKDVRFIISGKAGGDRRYFLKVKNRIAGSYLSKYISLFEYIENLPAFYRSLDVLVVASRVESFSLVTAEALASCVPVVATRCGGPEEIIVHGECGYLVPPGSPSRMAEAVLSLLASEIKRREFGLAGRRRVENFFSSDLMLEKTERILREAARDV